MNNTILRAAETLDLPMLDIDQLLIEAFTELRFKSGVKKVEQAMREAVREASDRNSLSYRYTLPWSPTVTEFGIFTTLLACGVAALNQHWLGLGISAVLGLLLLVFLSVEWVSVTSRMAPHLDFTLERPPRTHFAVKRYWDKLDELRKEHIPTEIPALGTPEAGHLLSEYLRMALSTHLKRIEQAADKVVSEADKRHEDVQEAKRELRHLASYEESYPRRQKQLEDLAQRFEDIAKKAAANKLAAQQSFRDIDLSLYRASQQFQFSIRLLSIDGFRESAEALEAENEAIKAQFQQLQVIRTSMHALVANANKELQHVEEARRELAEASGGTNG